MVSLAELADDGDIVVMGGGPAGALLATLLAEQGLDIVLYESRPDLRRTDIDAGRSINLALAERGMVALRRIGVMDQVAEITIPMAGRMIHADGGEHFQPYGSRPHEVIHSVSRTDLNAIMLDRAEATGRVRIEFNTRLRGIDFATRTLSMTDEANDDAPRTAHFGAVFGADGANSMVNQAIVSQGHSEVLNEPLDHGYKELEIRAADGGGFRIDPNALHIWPRGTFMLIALANPAGDFTVTLFMPNGGDGDSFESLATPGAVAEFFDREFPSFVALVPDLVDQFFENRLGHLGTVRTTGWSLDARACLVGDAAHSIVPFHGQGMNLALESALALDRHLRATPNDVGAAFASYEAERKADADAIADMALDNYIEMRSGVVDADYLIKRELALELERRWPQFIAPRYGMVMFTTIPYADVARRAQRQNEVLATLVEGVSSVAEVDFERAAELVEALGPVPAAEY